MLPNMSLEDKMDLKAFIVDLSTIERISGLSFFPNIIKKDVLCDNVECALDFKSKVEKLIKESEKKSK